MTNRNRNHLFHAHGTSLCSQCLTPVPAKIIIKNHWVFIRKRCPQHGETEHLLEENADWYTQRLHFNKPGTKTRPDTEFKKGCPLDCGLCPDHDQHTCIGLIEVTNHCNLQCPLCFAESNKKNDFLPLKLIKQMIDFFVEAEDGEAEILQISGGEPCSHPDIIKIIEAARTRGVKYVMLNTNGLRAAEDPDFVKTLTRFETGFEVYLQFDGFKKETHMHLRGRDLREIKAKALENLTKHKVPVTLVPTIIKGVNDDEIGAIVDYGLQTPCIRGINFQPEARFGRRETTNRQNKEQTTDRITLTGILERIGTQTDGKVTMGDFVPLPCNVDSVAVCYLYKKGNRFTPISRQIDIPSYLPIIDNTFYMDAEEILEKKQKESTFCDCQKYLDQIRRFLPAKLSAQSVKLQKEFIDNNTFRISVSQFLDADNFEMHAMQKECVHIITEDLKRIPFSAYNLIHRNRRTKGSQ